MVVEFRPEEQDDSFDKLLVAERDKLGSELETNDAQLDELQRRRDELAIKLEHIDALIGVDVPPKEWGGDGGDESPADMVVALLSETERPMHYREIERELRARGKGALEGQDPANTLLARYFADERLYRPKRGTYALRDWNRTARSVGTRRRRKTAKAKDQRP